MIQKDFLGREFLPGDMVVYPDRKGSEMWMNYAKVVNVLKNGLSVESQTSGKMSIVMRTDRVTILNR